MFVNRQRELNALSARYHSQNAEFVVVTGRRRVGKTALLSEFAGGKRALRFTAYLDSEESQLRRLSGLLRQIERPEMSAPAEFSYGSWETLFQTMGAIAAKERLLVILDEWPYLAGSSRRLASILQHVWDETLQQSHLMLALSGSYVSVMERGSGAIGFYPIPVRSNLAKPNRSCRKSCAQVGIALSVLLGKNWRGGMFIKWPRAI